MSKRAQCLLDGTPALNNLPFRITETVESHEMKLRQRIITADSMAGMFPIRTCAGGWYWKDVKLAKLHHNLSSIL